MLPLVFYPSCSIGLDSSAGRLRGGVWGPMRANKEVGRRSPGSQIEACADMGRRRRASRSRRPSRAVRSRNCRGGCDPHLQSSWRIGHSPPVQGFGHSTCRS